MAQTHIEVRPVCNSPADNKGKKGKNKMGENIPCIQYLINLFI